MNALSTQNSVVKKCIEAAREVHPLSSPPSLFSLLQVFTTALPSGGLETKSPSGDGAPKDALAPSSVVVPPAHVVCTFLDGGVGVYNLQQTHWVFLRDQGHIETIFDCQFQPRNANHLATGSFDGSIKVWDVRDMSAVS